MSDEEVKTRKPRAYKTLEDDVREVRGDKMMAGMNLEALHDKIELWGIAGVAAQFMARGMSGNRLVKAVADALDAARMVKGGLG